MQENGLITSHEDCAVGWAEQQRQLVGRDRRRRDVGVYGRRRTGHERAHRDDERLIDADGIVVRSQVIGTTDDLHREFVFFSNGTERVPRSDDVNGKVTWRGRRSARSGRAGGAGSGRRNEQKLPYLKQLWVHVRVQCQDSLDGGIVYNGDDDKSLILLYLMDTRRDGGWGGRDGRGLGRCGGCEGWCGSRRISGSECGGHVFGLGG